MLASEATRAAMRSREYGLLKPRGKFMQRWDIATAGALAFTLFVTPFEVGMDLPTSIDGGFIVLFVINQIVALIFLIDICVNFVLPTPNGTKGGYERRHWVRNADRTRCLLRTPFCLVLTHQSRPFRSRSSHSTTSPAGLRSTW